MKILSEPFDPDIYRDGQFILSLPQAEGLVRAVNRYGRDVRKMPVEIQGVVKCIVRNCYWGGMFGEVGMMCSRCDKLTCEHRG